MSKLKFWMLSILAVGILFTGCKDDDDDPINEAQVLVEYLESANSPLAKDYVNTDLPSIIPASEVKTLNETGKIYIIDIRAAADFATGHIENAVNVAFGDLLTHIGGVDLAPYDKVAIVCYTGQTTGYGSTLLRLMGYDKVYSMKWGMCSWHTDFAGKWNSNFGNAYATQMTADATAKGPENEMPELTTGETDPQMILEARMNTILAEGFTPAKVTKDEVFGNLAGYYIVNYWKEEHYNMFHIPGAMQYTPKASMAMAADLKTLPTDKPVVVYCYTGQTSAFLSAYLRLLGYDAKSLLFGVNGMAYDDMAAAGMTTWSDAHIMDYDYVN